MIPAVVFIEPTPAQAPSLAATASLLLLGRIDWSQARERHPDVAPADLRRAVAAAGREDGA